MSLRLACLLLLASLALPAAEPPKAETKPLAERPLRYAKDIDGFEAKDRKAPPPRHALLLAGASTLRLWQDAPEAFSPYPVINRGFGGAYTTEVLGYMDRITLPYQPRVVVYQCGGNDINAGDTPEAAFGRVREFLTRLRQQEPECAVVFLPTTRAPARRAKWPLADDFNRRLSALCQEGARLWFADINPALNQPDGEARPGHYLKDDLHPSALGYAAMARVVRPVVDEAWRSTEAAYAKRSAK